MIYYDWFMLDGESYSAPTVSVPANYTIPFLSVVTTSTTNLTIVAGTPTTVPLSYGGAISSLSNFNAFSDIDYRVLNDTDGVIYVTGLTPGKKYYLRIRAYSGADSTGTYGDYFYEEFTMPQPANVGGITSTTSATTTPSTTTNDTVSTKIMLEKILAIEAAEEASIAQGDANLSNATEGVTDNSGTEPTGTSYAAYKNREIQRSFFKISNTYKDTNRYAIEVKNIGISTSYKRYSFGAGILFSSVLSTPESSGGMGFFTDSVGKNGYFVQLQTDASNKDEKDKSLKIYKVISGKKILLQDSQDAKDGKLLGGVLSSKLYKLDIDVTINSSATVIDVYVNNFKVTAADSNPSGETDPAKKPIAPTPSVALFSALEITNFDYIYANPIDSTQANNTSSRGLYTGQYSLATLDFLFGEKIVQNFNSPENKVAYLEEFGPTVREIRYVKANFAQPAAIPLYASTGVNKFATILGSKFSNHGAEIFVMNNAGSFIPLAYGNEQKFFVVGNYVDMSSQHEYTESSTNEYTVLEPATFQSTWIQSESDAKSLFNWIKNQWSKQQQSVNMEIFGNPAIEVGDVISITYSKNDLNGTQKFLVTNVNLDFEEGVSTSITARSIYG